MTIIDLLAAVPSVVYGLWGLLVLAPKITGLLQGLANDVRHVPVLNTLFSGRPAQRA